MHEVPDLQDIVVGQPKTGMFFSVMGLTVGKGGGFDCCARLSASQRRCPKV
jgi:hypothetical protein